MERTPAVPRVYDVPRMVLNFSKSSSMMRSVQRVSARADGMMGFLPVYDRCLGTRDPYEVMVTSGRLSYLRSACVLPLYIILYLLYVF